MGTLVVVYVASHVVSQKSLQRKLLSTVGALKHLFPVGNVLPFAVVQKFHLAKKSDSGDYLLGHQLGDLTLLAKSPPQVGQPTSLSWEWHLHVKLSNNT